MGQVRRPHRIEGEKVLHVHEQQLLVLLLMVEAEIDQVEQRWAERSIEKVVHGGVDVAPVLGDFVERRTGQQSADRARVPGADRIVVGIEEVAEHRVERPVARKFLQQQEGLEEPGRVSLVPLRGAGIRHRLRDLVLWRQWGSEQLGQRPDLVVAADQVQRSDGRADVGWGPHRNAALHFAPFNFGPPSGEPATRASDHFLWPLVADKAGTLRLVT